MVKTKEDRAIEHVLGKGLLKGLEKRGFSRNFLLHLYHQSSRKETFRSEMKGIIYGDDGCTKVFDDLEKLKENHRKSIKTIENMEKGLLQEMITN